MAQLQKLPYGEIEVDADSVYSGPAAFVATSHAQFPLAELLGEGGMCEAMHFRVPKTKINGVQVVHDYLAGRHT